MPLQPEKLERAIGNLKLLHDELGVVDVIACGERAVPALRKILFEMSGLYQVRCRAVEALTCIGAYEVLIEFLEAERTITDPIVRAGEDAVINAAAIAASRLRERRVFDLLLRLARRPALTGVLAALGAFANAEAIPALIDALEEDASRFTAENALRKIGQAARIALLGAVNLKLPSAESESESSARRRRSALRLLAEMDGRRSAWADLRHLVHDRDAKVAALACEIGLARACPSERTVVVRRLIELLGEEDWLLREEIGHCLMDHADSSRGAIMNYLDESADRDEGTALRTKVILRRIFAPEQSTPKKR